MSDRYATGVVAAVTLIALVGVAFLIPVPYVAMRPGPAFNTLGNFGDKHMFTIKGAATFPTKGGLRFTTVSVSSADARVPLGSALQGVVDPDIEVLPRELIYRNGSTPTQNKQQGASELTSSKDNSRVAALRAAGYRVTESARIVAVAKGAPADGRLRVGDVVVAVDGTNTPRTAQVVEKVQAHRPGSSVAITVRRSGRLLTLDVGTMKAPDGSGARVGVALRRVFRYPLTITNNVDDSIGGSSAGTMFALAIYDLLTPGALTGGLDVAGTGEIDVDGHVGAIGGIRQKMAGAARAGADFFLVPAGNCSDALRGDDDGMRLIRITTLKGAIDAIKKLAADPSAKVPACR